MAIHAADPKKSEQLKMILHALSFGPVSTFTLQESSGSMCPATRISELRARGYKITSERRGGVYFYTLHKEVTDAAA